MEGAAVPQVFVERGVPFVETRILSDEASGDAAADFEFTERSPNRGKQKTLH